MVTFAVNTPITISTTRKLNLVIDIGNTRVKAASFDKHSLTNLFVYNNTESFISDFELKFKGAKQVIISSVLHNKPDVVEKLKFNETPIFFSGNIPLPIHNLYRSPNTLGSDRLAAAVAAESLYKNANVLNIDTGTCIKYNFVSSDSKFLGGATSPGLVMRLKSLHSFTAGLPLVEFNTDFNELIGTDTQDSILSGALLGAIAEADGIINQYKQRFPGLTVVVSGGDTEFFVKRLKNSTFARPHLVLEGLNKILEYNVNK